MKKTVITNELELETASEVSNALQTLIDYPEYFITEEVSIDSVEKAKEELDTVINSFKDKKNSADYLLVKDNFIKLTDTDGFSFRETRFIRVLETTNSEDSKIRLEILSYGFGDDEYEGWVLYYPVSVIDKAEFSESIVKSKTIETGEEVQREMTEKLEDYKKSYKSFITKK